MLYGYESVAPTFAVENGECDLDVHAEALAEAEKESGGKEFIRVGHSWAANIIPRKITPGVRLLIFDAGVFHQPTLPHILPDSFPAIEHSASYEIIKKDPDRFLLGLADITFFQDAQSDPQLQQWAIDLLRVNHTRRDCEPLLERKPTIPAVYLKHTRDNTITQDSQDEMARAYGAHVEVLEGDHGAMVTRHKTMAEYLIKIAENYY